MLLGFMHAGRQTTGKTKRARQIIRDKIIRIYLFLIIEWKIIKASWRQAKRARDEIKGESLLSPELSG